MATSLYNDSEPLEVPPMPLSCMTQATSKVADNSMFLRRAELETSFCRSCMQSTSAAEMMEQNDPRARKISAADLSSTNPGRWNKSSEEGARSVQHHNYVEGGGLSRRYDLSKAHIHDLDLTRNELGNEAHDLSSFNHGTHHKEKAQESCSQKLDIQRQRIMTQSDCQDPVDNKQELRRPKPEPDTANPKLVDRQVRYSYVATGFYTTSYLVLFAILGTLARLGLQALTFYPGAPVQFSVLWPNLIGTFIFGFLGEDHRIFRSDWMALANQNDGESAAQSRKDEEVARTDSESVKGAHMTLKKTIPLYVGLATGFCGSLTSFSSFIRDIILAITNDLPNADTESMPRNGGYSFMAAMAIAIITITSCLSALYAGVQIAVACETRTPSLSFMFARKVLDPFMAFIAWGCWLGAILLAILPPDRGGSTEAWRGRVLFAIAFAPLGCLCRFYTSIQLNGKLASFPLGTFMVNVVGTLLLGAMWDLQHVPVGGQISCQVLQGIQDGFCGCLTTISTWCGELVKLNRAQSYRYGMFTVLASTCLLIIIMGSFRWTHGFAIPSCIT